MPIRPRVQRVTPTIDPFEVFEWGSNDTFTETFVGPGFRSEAEARRWWPTWARDLAVRAPGPRPAAGASLRRRSV
jgi:hypothetical protein